MPAEPDKMKERLRLATADHKSLLVRQEDEIRKVLESDPERPRRERELNGRSVEKQIAELRSVLESCKPLSPESSRSFRKYQTKRSKPPLTSCSAKRSNIPRPYLFWLREG